MTLPWIFASKNTNSKHQITNKSQIPIFNGQKLPGRTCHCLDFGILVMRNAGACAACWNLFFLGVFLPGVALAKTGAIKNSFYEPINFDFYALPRWIFVRFEFLLLRSPLLTTDTWAGENQVTCPLNFIRFYSNLRLYGLRRTP